MLRAAWIAVTIVGATASPASAQEAAGTVADVRAAAAVDSLLAIHRTILRAHTDRS